PQPRPSAGADPASQRPWDARLPRDRRPLREVPARRRARYDTHAHTRRPGPLSPRRAERRAVLRERWRRQDPPAPRALAAGASQARPSRSAPASALRTTKREARFPGAAPVADRRPRGVAQRIEREVSDPRGRGFDSRRRISRASPGCPLRRHDTAAAVELAHLELGAVVP